VHIPKGSDPTATRPIGIPTLEDKVLQRAVLMLLEAVYEQDFVEGSYGFRPGRSALQALEALKTTLERWNGGWVLEIDIERFFDTLDHGHLRTMLHQRVRDGVVLRLIGKWLNAGVFEAGAVTYPEQGSPQGGVVSPLLANVYLHEVLDRWFEEQVKPRLRGRAQLIRYADDAALVFSDEQDARRVVDVLAKRFGKYGLTLHPKKTRLVAFSRPSQTPPSGGVLATAPESFDMLGFTHVWKRSRFGRWMVGRRTSRSRLSRALGRIREWCREHRHDPVCEQHATLSQKVRGHYAYFGLRGNSEGIDRFAQEVQRIWHKWLSRRGSGRMTWERFKALLTRFPLPPPRLVHRHVASP
jgi:group II intron reverse transcriptase/maturase